jgi:ferritin
MFTEKMQEALNKQINAELYSSYLYLSMSAYFQSVSLSGFANWMRVQAQEELVHAMKFYDFVNERNGRVVLEKIEKPETEWKSAIEVFEHSLNHEQGVTRSINNLANLAVEERDHATQIFLQWFITEQIEEESSASDVLHKLKLTGGEGSGLFMLDRELATRVFVPPVVNQ